MSVEHALRPFECRVGRTPRQSERHELLSFGLEDVELAEAGGVAAHVGRLRCGAGRAEPAVERLVGGVELVVPFAAVEHVVVAGEDRIGKGGILERLHRTVGCLPLALGAGAVHDVAQVCGERDAEVVGVLRDPSGLDREGIGAISRHELVGRVSGVELRVGQHREGEPRREVIGGCRIGRGSRCGCGQRRERAGREARGCEERGAATREATQRTGCGRDHGYSVHEGRGARPAVGIGRTLGLDIRRGR
jgi:hypothetical protein